jgi:hypothetical protein
LGEVHEERVADSKLELGRYLAPEVAAVGW